MQFSKIFSAPAKNVLSGIKDKYSESVRQLTENPMILQINKQIHFTSSIAALAAQDEAQILGAVHFLEIGGSSGNGADLQLPVIHAFCETLASTVENRPCVPIVVCPDISRASTLRSACLLCGAYMLLCDFAALDLVVSTFSGVLRDIDLQQDSSADEAMLSCWRALAHARDLRWLDMRSDGAEPVLDLELAGHYALAAKTAACAC